MDELGSITHPFSDIYDALYREINPGSVPTINAADAAAFLKRSNLNVQVLGQIWEVADYQHRGVLDRRGIYMALKLVAAAQQGFPVLASSLYTHSLQPPSFIGTPAAPYGQHSPSQPAAPAQWAIDAADQAKYDSIFESLTPIGGKLPGAKVRPVLLNSGLNPTSLAKIWELSDQDKDGQLDRIEMAVALHLVYRALQNEAVPSSLPPSLVHPTKAHLSRRTSVSSQGPPQSFGNFGGISNGPRSRAGSVASLDGIGMASAPTGILPQSAERSMSAQPIRNGSISIPGTPIRGQPSPGGPWPVDRIGCAAQFAACDTDSDGLVSGGDVRHVLLSSGLQQQILAHIWELADVNKNGTLNHEQFALIVHFVQMSKRGEELPVVLPAHLLPPSLRHLNLNGSNGDVGLETSVSSTSLGHAAQSENPEIRQLAEEMEKLLNERREADSQVTQLEADMTVKNSAIKNLQIELQTLESTVKQLDRQRAEAGRRLGELDEQIRQLEAAGTAQSAKGSETQSRLEQLRTDTEEGAASAEMDQSKIAEARSELYRLETDGRTISAQLVAEQRSVEVSVDEITKAERETERDLKQLTDLKAETERVRNAMAELQAAADSEDAPEQLKNKIHLLSSMEKSNMFHDPPFGVPSTSSQNSFHQPPDPFAGTQSALAHVDPFAQTDPFSAAPASGTFAGGFPSDPFSGGLTQAPFGAVAQPVGYAAAKAPPPRPAPPKSTSARQTPVQEDPFNNADPFAGQPTNGGGGFADFSNFGSFN